MGRNGITGARRRRRLAACLLAAALLVPGAFIAATPPAVHAAECNGDECQGPPVAPEDPVPGTALFEGPPNPPVHYPKVHKRHHKKPQRSSSHGRGRP